MKKISIILLIMVFMGCDETTFPKPKGYFRIDLPEAKYEFYDLHCPLAMELSRYSKVERIIKENTDENGCWFNILYPRLNARLHCTYLPVEENLPELLENAYNFAFQHEVKANAIERTRVDVTDTKVHGMIYDLGGDVASQVQFFITDSTSHFLRGSLYFNNKPNQDSLRPVVSYLRQDILNMLESAQWEKSE